MRAAKTFSGAVLHVLIEEFQHLTQVQLLTVRKVKQPYMALPH